MFPTLTFPNHWALQTGLYVESHGIVANDFYAPDLLQSFSSRKKSSWNPEWWWGEPIWSVAERGGRRAANVMWPGPPQMSSGISPSFFVPFRKATPMEKLPQIEEYLDAPIHLAPSFVQVYIPDVDTAGHRGGPESAEVEDALRRVDEFVGALRGSIDSRNLTGIVDLVLLSDHGMAATSASRLVFIDDVLGDGYADLESRDGWPSLGLRFKRGADIEAHLARLKRASNDSFAVYTKDTMPDRWHFSHGDRVAPIYLVPQLGWVLTDHLGDLRSLTAGRVRALRPRPHHQRLPRVRQHPPRDAGRVLRIRPVGGACKDWARDRGRVGLHLPSCP